VGRVEACEVEIGNKEAQGFDEDLEDVMQYGVAIINMCKAGKFTRILCNELDLEYRLGVFDTYKSAQFMAENIPYVGHAAIVCSAKFMADAAFWETVAVNRGLSVRVFKDMETARRWLEE
jgi:hypothetical protein